MGNVSESQAAGDKITDPMKQGMKIGCVLLFSFFLLLSLSKTLFVWAY